MMFRPIFVVFFLLVHMIILWWGVYQLMIIRNILKRGFYDKQYKPQFRDHSLASIFGLFFVTFIII